MSTEVSNAQVMPYEADHDIKTLLFLLQAAADSPSAGTEAEADPEAKETEEEKKERARKEWDFMMDAMPGPGHRDRPRR